VLSDGRLFWIQDAYATSTNYPYSTPADNGVYSVRTRGRECGRGCVQAQRRGARSSERGQQPDANSQCR